MKILITGASGFIGSNLLPYLTEHEILTIDNKPSNSPNFNLIDITNYDALVKCFKDFSPDLVIHLAALISVGESEKEPEKYYLHNLQGTANVLQAMLQVNCKKIIFSSTAALYGNNDSKKALCENDTSQPQSVYGETKQYCEELLKNYYIIFNFNIVIFRFFNAAGGMDHHQVQMHLIPIILQSIKNKKQFNIFGNDYPTGDGTCVRDYIHVHDLNNAIVLAIDYLHKNQGLHIFNLGSNTGYSVHNIISKCQAITGQKLDINIAARRPGDPAYLLADASKAHEILKWQASKSIDDIIRDTWNEL